MKEKILTIAIPTYNGANTISNMLNILLPQVNDKIEVLISDNCSTDSTPEIISEYKTKYPFIKYIRNNQNIGADGNFLQCMRMANGKFTMLLSDDDIFVENSLKNVISFLESNSEVSLVFLYTVGFVDKYIDIEHCTTFNEYSVKPDKNICTTDKKEFFKYIGRQWGFTSSFLWKTERAQQIKNPEQFCNTYWFQSYIHIMCSNKSSDLLGIIADPCIAAGGYGVIGNYDTSQIEGVYFKKMLDFAVDQAGYDKKQLEKLWLWKVCFLGCRAIIKERSIGISITSKKELFKILHNHLYAWVHLFPVFLIPNFICKLILKYFRKKQGRSIATRINRPT